MVIAKFKEDGNHYRAIVRKIDGDNIHITYVDFGNVEVSSMKHMLELPTELKAVCVKIFYLVFLVIFSIILINFIVAQLLYFQRDITIISIYFSLKCYFSDTLYFFNCLRKQEILFSVPFGGSKDCPERCSY